jgi:hypothetical protein
LVAGAVAILGAAWDYPYKFICDQFFQCLADRGLGDTGKTRDLFD